VATWQEEDAYCVLLFLPFKGRNQKISNIKFLPLEEQITAPLPILIL
jgi:hypothetical protein